MTLEALKNMLKDNMNQIHHDICYCLRKVKTTPANMKSKQRNLTAMIDEYGLPTIFNTFSYADQHWSDLKAILQPFYNKHNLFDPNVPEDIMDKWFKEAREEHPEVVQEQFVLKFDSYLPCFLIKT